MRRISCNRCYKDPETHMTIVACRECLKRFRREYLSLKFQYDRYEIHNLKEMMDECEYCLDLFWKKRDKFINPDNPRYDDIHYY